MKLKPQLRPRVANQTRLKTVLMITGATFAFAGIVGGVIFFYLNVGIPTTAKAATNITGVINSYLRVTAISTKTFTADNLSGSIGDFAVGKTVMVYQAKGATITTTNTASYGTITAMNNAGNYEFATVSAFSGTGPYSITVATLSSSYTVSGAVQLISVPKYTDASITGTITATAWSATQGRGGVVAMQVSGTLNLGANIDVSTQGFSGGAVAGSNGDCPNNSTFTSSSNNHGAKGEGVSTNGNLYGNGPQANAGGGGNPHNAGGGGGSNHTTGGNGGQGYQPGGGCAVVNAGGLAGKAFNYASMATKIFFGGGGGAGQQNNNVATNGGNGGGIIVIQAKNVTSTCGGTYGFRANGQSATNSGADGAGGGGAGGSIVLDVLNYTLTCGLVVQSNGGSGGTVTDPATHGGGAGGGVGIIEETHATSNTNVTLLSTVGAAGKDCNTCTTGTPTPASPPTSSRRSISSVPGTGTITLPVKLISFTGMITDKQVELNWVTASEQDNDYFTIERSKDGIQFDSIMAVKGAGTSTEQLRYAELDTAPIVTTAVYYRLKQTDFNGTYEYSNVIRIDTESLLPQDGLTLYPNPASETLMIHNAKEGGLSVRIFNERGLTIFTKSAIEPEMQIDVRAMNNGMYTVEITANGKRKVEKLIIRH
jgi:hypothetical protein